MVMVIGADTVRTILILISQARYTNSFAIAFSNSPCWWRLSSFLALAQTALIFLNFKFATLLQ